MTIIQNTPTKPSEPSRFRDRYGPWAVVTGASDGIGRAMAKELAAAGVNLVLVARRVDVLATLGQELAAAHGVETAVVAVDLAPSAGVGELLARTADLDVGLLVAAAGFGTAGRFLDNDLAVELDMLDVNCRAVAALGYHFGRRFVARKRGGLVFLSSLVAFQGAPRAAHYAATKAYVQTLAEGLRAELAPFGVAVVAAAPGPVQSGFAARAGLRMNQAADPRTIARGTLAALGRRGTVRPGGLAKLLGWSLATLPRWARVRVMSSIMGGMTAHRR